MLVICKVPGISAPVVERFGSQLNVNVVYLFAFGDPYSNILFSTIVL